MDNALTLNTLGSHMGTGSKSGSFTSLLVTWESSEGRPKALGPCIHVGHPEEVPGSWLQIGIASAIALSWGLNLWTEHLPLCLSSLCI